MNWTDEAKVTVKALWEEGKSALEIAVKFGVSRNAICGLANRSGWQTPNSPMNRPRVPKEKRMRQVPYNITKAKKRQDVPPPLGPVEPDMPPTIDDLAIPFEQRRTLLELQKHHCRFPIGDPRGDFFFCGAVTLKDGPYCEGHAARCFVPPEGRRNGRFSLPKFSTSAGK